MVSIIFMPLSREDDTTVPLVTMLRDMMALFPWMASVSPVLNATSVRQTAAMVGWVRVRSKIYTSVMAASTMRGTRAVIMELSRVRLLLIRAIRFQGLYCSKKRIGWSRILLSRRLPERAEVSRLVLLTSKVLSPETSAYSSNTVR